MTEISVSFGLNDEYEQKKVTLKELHRVLTEVFIQRDEILNHHAKSIEMRFYSLIGIFKLELLEIEKEFRRLKLMTEMIQSRLNSLQSVDMVEINLAINKELINWENAINVMKSKIEQSILYYSNIMSEDDANEIKRIYRILVKLLHPDININLDEEMINLWYATVKAFKNGDLNTLKNIHILIASKLKTDSIDFDDNIDLRINSVREQINTINLEIELIKSKYPFTLQDRINNRSWVKDQQEEIRLKKMKFENGIEYYLHHLSNLELIIANGQPNQN